MAKATLTYDGKTLGYKEWAQEVGISEVTIRRRVSMGWTVEQVLTTGVERKSWAETLTFDGITDTYAGWAQRIGISECQLRRRLSQKAHVHEDSVWTLEKALTTPPKRSSWNEKQTVLKQHGLGKMTTDKNFNPLKQTMKHNKCDIDDIIEMLSNKDDNEPASDVPTFNDD